MDRLIQANGVGLKEALAIEKKFVETDKHKRWHDAGMPLNTNGTCQGIKGPDGLGYHRQPYVTGTCDHAACADNNKKSCEGSIDSIEVPGQGRQEPPMVDTRIPRQRWSAGKLNMNLMARIEKVWIMTKLPTKNFTLVHATVDWSCRL